MSRLKVCLRSGVLGVHRVLLWVIEPVSPGQRRVGCSFSLFFPVADLCLIIFMQLSLRMFSLLVVLPSQEYKPISLLLSILEK